MLIKIKHNISLEPKVLVKSKAPIIESNFEPKSPRQNLEQKIINIPVRSSGKIHRVSNIETL